MTGFCAGISRTSMEGGATQGISDWRQDYSRPSDERGSNKVCGYLPWSSGGMRICLCFILEDSDDMETLNSIMKETSATPNYEP
nr:hypothetical protein CFP56_03362 [Quercus suber]